MHCSRVLLLLFSTSLLVFAAGEVQAGLVVTHISTQEQLDDLIDEIAFVGEGRIGRSGYFKASVPYELGLGTDPDDLERKKKYTWSNGEAVRFELSYDAAENEVVFLVGGRKLTFQPTRGGEATDIAVRAYAEKGGCQLELYDLVLDGKDVGEELAVEGPSRSLDILRIQGGSPSGGFTLSGTVVMRWSGKKPVDEELAFHVGAFKSVRPTGTETTSWGEIKSKFR